MYCRAPFISITINKNKIGCCCHLDIDGISKEQLRIDMYNDDIHDLCKHCCNRFVYNKKEYDEVFNYNIKNFDVKKGTIKNQKYGYVIFVPTFKCNAECIMCGTYKQGKSERDDLLRINDFFTQESLSLCKLFMIQGGEVTLFPKIFKDINENIPKTCSITMMTNAMVYDEYILNILNKYDNPTITFSIDGIPKINNKYRKNTDYHTIINNVNKIKNNYPEIKLEYNITVHIFNIEYLVDTIIKIESDLNDSNIGHCINPVFFPKNISITSLSERTKQDLIDLILKNEKAKEYVKQGYFKRIFSCLK